MVLLLTAAVATACVADQGGVVAGDDGAGADWTAGVGVGTGGGAGGSSDGGMGIDGTLWPLPELDRWEPVDTAWCSDGWIGLDESTCAYLPASNPAPSGVLVFVHGMMPPDASPLGQQQVVAQAAETLGVAALFPRGRAGLCAWDDSVLDWYCWPTSRETVDAHAASVIAEWDGALELMQTRLDVPLTERYVMGFSNGGYFASYIGLEGWWAVEGFGLVAAGRAFIDAALLGEASPPAYIAVGGLDSQPVQNGAQNLAYFLSLEGWPHQYVLHAQRGHEIWPDDIETAGALWGVAGPK